jgi:hypothetical protein
MHGIEARTRNQQRAREMADRADAARAIVELAAFPIGDKLGQVLTGIVALTASMKGPVPKTLTGAKLLSGS